MSRNDVLFGELDASRRRFLSEVEGLDEEHFGRRPPDGGWSVAQAVEHIARSEAVMAKGFKLAAAGRLAVRTEFADHFRRLLWTFGVYRLVSIRTTPALDPEKSQSRVDSLAQLGLNRENLLSAIPPGPLTGFRMRHPVFGPLSGEEMLRFAALHEERHRLQIVRIKRSLGVR